MIDMFLRDADDEAEVGFREVLRCHLALGLDAGQLGAEDQFVDGDGFPQPLVGQTLSQSADGDLLADEPGGLRRDEPADDGDVHDGLAKVDARPQLIGEARHEFRVQGGVQMRPHGGVGEENA